MKETVREGLKSLGQDHSPAAVERLWEDMNQQVDQIAETWQIKRLETWASDANLVPRSLEEIRNLFLQDQREAAWTVIDQYLTEPINALMEQQDQDDPWATEWDN